MTTWWEITVACCLTGPARVAAYVRPISADAAVAYLRRGPGYGVTLASSEPDARANARRYAEHWHALPCSIPDVAPRAVKKRRRRKPKRRPTRPRTKRPPTPALRPPTAVAAA